jgi:multidrug efflux pump subunit AcrA (membrane-fusion protein)
MHSDRLWPAWRALLVAATVSLAACGGAADEEEAPPVVTVDVAPVLNAAIQRTIRTQAVIYPLQQAAIVPKIVAPIKKVHVERGAHVRAGQLLLELENADLAAAAHENEAAYQAAQSAFETTSRTTVPEDVQKAELDVQAGKTALDAQQSVFDNRQQLFREGAIAQKDVNDAQVALSQARSNYEIARKRLEDLEGFGRDQTLKAAAAQREQAQGRRDTAQAQLSYSRIVSPIAGTVTVQPPYAGETPAAGTPIITVMDLSKVTARAHITPAEAAELTIGNDAGIIGLDGAPIPGKITQISPALDTGSTTVEVWVEASNDGERLKPGMSLRVELVARTVPAALVIPESALLTSNAGSTSVIVIDPENAPHKIPVSVGIRDAGKVQIVDGLASGQRVATSGAFELAKLEPDVLAKAKVQIQPPKEEPDDDEP